MLPVTQLSGRLLVAAYLSTWERVIEGPCEPPPSERAMRPFAINPGLHACSGNCAMGPSLFSRSHNQRCWHLLWDSLYMVWLTWFWDKKFWKPPVPGNFTFSPCRSDSSLIEGNLLGSCLRGHTLTLAPQNFTTCNWWFLLLKLVLRVGTHTLQQHHHPSAFSDRLWRSCWQKLSPIPTPGAS